MKNSAMSRPLYEVDPEISNAIDNEVRRQHEGLELIASNEVHPYHLLRYDRVIFSHPALEKLQLTLKDTLPKRQRKAAKEEDEGAKKAAASPRKRVRHEKAAEVA